METGELTSKSKFPTACSATELVEPCVENLKAAREHQCTKLYGRHLQYGSAQRVSNHAHRAPDRTNCVSDTVLCDAGAVTHEGKDGESRAI